MTTGILVVSVFLACLVESVEALTIVLAAGVSRGWRSAVQGAVGGFLLLAVIVAVLGPALTVVPLGALRVVVGALLLVFGLQWIRKGVLRASGYKGLHDETALFAEHRSAADGAAPTRRGAVQDWYGFTLAFKGVLLEGLEVAFIVLTFGANAHRTGVAVIGAVAAVAVVVVAGFAVRAPLSRVPENTMKLVVGVMLTAFGTFWGAEGAGVHWPGSDVALLPLIAFVAVLTAVLVAVLRRQHARVASGVSTSGVAAAAGGR